MRTDGTKRLRPTDDDFRNRGPKWIRGNDWLVFYSNRGGEYQVWLMRADGTDARQLTRYPVAINEPAVSPDGARLACGVFGATQKGLVILPVEENRFAATAPRPASEFKVAAENFIPMSWSPDEASIAGTVMTPQGTLSAVYTCATNQLDVWSAGAGT